MSPQSNQRTLLAIGPLFAIASVVGLAATAFAYTAGWLTPRRLTPDKLVAALAPPSGQALGHRRNHIKGICFTGTFTANGAGEALSTAEVFTPGQYPVVGRFNVPGGDPHMPDAMAQARGFSIRITTPHGGDWRSAMLDAPFFAASSPQAFYQFLSAAGSKDPGTIKSYLAAHPETSSFIAWAKTHPRTESWTEDRFNSLNSFLFIDNAGVKHAVRWSLIPSATPVLLSPDQLAARPPDFLQMDIAQRVGTAPRHWEMVLTVANPNDPTADPTKTWPADRRTLDVGTLAANHVETESDGPCRDINFDPAVLPAGITTSDDTFPAARSAAYRVSYDHRMAEAKNYPRGGAQ
ncbi:catalase family peroxidase [Terriglobus roseus]|uniref:Catalase-related peroxidase n=1 Tax=Terriglobus roseus TaxID=392734 RepID=A0A1H4K6X8_9BACT|nr:catalase family peroxidase [Terriglobus roseus]SEB54271.1 catalase [Terriglobus roseus]